MSIVKFTKFKCFRIQTFVVFYFPGFLVFYMFFPLIKLRNTVEGKFLLIFASLKWIIKKKKMEKRDQKLKNMGGLEKLEMALTWELVRKWDSQSYRIGKELNSANNLNEKTNEESRSSLRAFREEYGLQYFDLSLVKPVLIFWSLFCIIPVVQFS